MLAGVLLAVGAVACADGSDAGHSAREETSYQVTVTRATLVDAAGSARRYGRIHLGHFLELRPRDLLEDGVARADGISVAVRSAHASYCIRVTNELLPSSHPWRVATLGSRNPVASSADRCRS